MTMPTTDTALQNVSSKTRLIFKIGFFVFAAAVIAVLCYAAVTLTNTQETEEAETLVLVHLLLHHGERTPEQQELYEANPYYNKSFYYPYGYGRLTKTGKLTEYQIGEELRTRYSSFLGDSYSINLVDPRSANVDMSKVSVQLVLAALFLPTGDLVWNETLLWQPTPYNYVADDKVLYDNGSADGLTTLELDGCGDSCTVDAVSTFVADYIPSDSDC